MKRLTLIISIALALAVAGALAGEARSAGAPQASSASVANLVPSRITSFEWLRGQIAWRADNISRLRRSVFQFAPGGRFTFFQPGHPTLRGRFSISGGTAYFSGSYVFSTYPSGRTTSEIEGTIDLRTGGTQMVLTAGQILTGHIGRGTIGLTNVKMYRAQLVLRVA